jgi:hypothetical protein
VSDKDGNRSKRKTAVTQESTNFYATNFELGSVSPLFIHQFSRSRWRIDTEVFQTITTDCHREPETCSKSAGCPQPQATLRNRCHALPNHRVRDVEVGATPRGGPPSSFQIGR